MGYLFNRIVAAKNLLVYEAAVEGNGELIDIPLLKVQLDVQSAAAEISRSQFELAEAKDSCAPVQISALSQAPGEHKHAL